MHRIPKFWCWNWLKRVQHVLAPAQSHLTDHQRRMSHKHVHESRECSNSTPTEMSRCCKMTSTVPWIHQWWHHVGHMETPKHSNMLKSYKYRAPKPKSWVYLRCDSSALHLVSSKSTRPSCLCRQSFSDLILSSNSCGNDDALERFMHTKMPLLLINDSWLVTNDWLMKRIND